MKKEKRKRMVKITTIILLLISQILLVIAIEQTTKYSTIIPENNTETSYEKGKTHIFSTTWTNTTPILNVTIQHNFTNINTNKELTGVSSGNELTYSYSTELGAGTYFWSMTAVTENETITTPTHTYQVNKAEPIIHLFLNSQKNNITINETEQVNITGILELGEGTLEIKIGNKTIGTIISNQTINQTINIIEEFNQSGEYVIQAKQQETENYTEKEIILNITVNEKQSKLTIETDKEKYSLGEDAKYLINAPDYSQVEITICRNSTIGNIQWEECTPRKIIQNETFPILFSHRETQRPGIYRINAKIINKNIQTSKTYEVIDTMRITVTGNTKININEETTLSVTATGAISPYTYTWLLPNGTTRTGTDLRIRYPTTGTRTITVTAMDKYENTKNQTINLQVIQYFNLTIEVKNSQNQIIRNATVAIINTGENKKTDTTGKTRFELEQDTYRIRISAPGYETEIETISLDATTNKTINLITKITTNNQIQLKNPTQNTIQTNKNVNFEAEINLDETSTCKLFIADKNSQWFTEFSKKENQKEGKITFTENLDIGEYKWKIICETANSTKESEIRNLSIRTQTTFTDQPDERIDAGELRRQIENAQNNLNALNLEARKAADAMNLQETLRISLRDYERILRDINSIALRRDLTEAQKEEKLQEYKTAIKLIESTTPLEIEILDFKEFITYPTKEELEQIATEYGQIRNLQGTLDKQEVENLQNLIRTRTFSAQIEITYISGKTQNITLIHKTIEYTEEKNRNHFLLEKIPNTIQSQITVKQTHDLLIKDSLIRFEIPEQITYYFEGLQSIEETKKTHTILLTESVFKTRGSTTGINRITGLVTFATTDINPTTSLILILSILIIAYIIYTFDIIQKLKEKIKGLGKDKKLKELRMLIQDAKDYLDTENIERANLIYKEIKILYEKASKTIKKEIYEEAIKLIHILNEKYINHLILKTQQEIKNDELQNATKTYNKLIEIYNKLEPEQQRQQREITIKLNKELNEKMKNEKK